jgi:tetratricopeptide (TPR) repeat protein
MRNQLDEGERHLDRALELDPSLAAAWYNRGLARFHGQRWSEAVADFKRALELAPGNVEIIPLLQRAQSRVGRAAGDGG